MPVVCLLLVTLLLKFAGSLGRFGERLRPVRSEKLARMILSFDSIHGGILLFV